jgi:hypothetical protein
MPNSPVFEWVSHELELATVLSRLEARGTVRLALQELGLTVTGVARSPMQFTLARVLPRLLSSRGIAAAEVVCKKLSKDLESADLPLGHESPEDIFARLGGDAPSDPGSR